MLTPCHTLFIARRPRGFPIIDRMANAIRGAVSFGIVAIVAGLVATWLASESRAESDQPSLAGAWTMNKDLSDQPAERDDRGNRGDDRGRRGGGRGRGGFGGGYGGGRGGFGRGGGQAVDPEERARMRDAMRDIMSPPDHLVITQTETMLVITGPDGRTTRLAPDGKKIKDENTGIERRTKWDAGHLVSEISGPGGMKATETYAINPELHQLRLTTQFDGGRGGQPRSVTHVYDSEGR